MLLQRNKYKISEICDILFGFHSEYSEQGDIAYIQAKHINEWGTLSNPLDSFVVIPSSNINNYLLQDKDILLPSKGTKFIAYCYQKEIIGRADQPSVLKMN